MGHSGAGGKLIHEKNQKQKISWHCPFNIGLEQNSECFFLFCKMVRNGIPNFLSSAEYSSERNYEVWSVFLFYEMVRKRIPSFFIFCKNVSAQNDKVLFNEMPLNGILSFFVCGGMAQKSERNSEVRFAAEGIKISVCSVFRGIIFFSSENGNPRRGVGYEEGRGLPAVHTALQLSEFIGLQHKLQ